MFLKTNYFQFIVISLQKGLAHFYCTTAVKHLRIITIDHCPRGGGGNKCKVLIKSAQYGRSPRNRY